MLSFFCAFWYRHLILIGYVLLKTLIMKGFFFLVKKRSLFSCLYINMPVRYNIWTLHMLFLELNWSTCKLWHKILNVWKWSLQEPFPLHAICGSIWKNTEGQLSFLKYAVSAPPEIFTFAHSGRQLVWWSVCTLAVSCSHLKIFMTTNFCAGICWCN